MTGCVPGVEGGYCTKNSIRMNGCFPLLLTFDQKEKFNDWMCSGGGGGHLK